MALNRPDSREAALAAFTESKAEIDAILARLTAHSADHFGVAPDEVNWGTVGALDHILAELREVSDNLFNEGEYA